mgnify:CR=1 FL=1
MSSNDLNRVITEIEIAAGSTKSLCRALSFLHESFQDSGHDAAGILLLLSNAAFKTSEELTDLAEKLDGEDEAEQDKAALAEDDYSSLAAMLKRRKALSGNTPVEFTLSIDEFADLAALAKREGQGVDEFASALISDRIKKELAEPA